MGNTNRSSTCVLQSRADGDRSPKWASYTIPEEVLITVCVGGGGYINKRGVICDRSPKWASYTIPEVL